MRGILINLSSPPPPQEYGAGLRKSRLFFFNKNTVLKESPAKPRMYERQAETEVVVAFVNMFHMKGAGCKNKRQGQVKGPYF